MRPCTPLSRLVRKNDCEKSLVHLILIMLVITLAGCTSSSLINAASAGTYKYTPVIRDSSGHYVSGVSASPNEIVFYHYGFNRIELEKINSDMRLAVKIFIEKHQAIPPECTKGIRVAKIIAVENASLLTANIECEK